MATDLLGYGRAGGGFEEKRSYKVAMELGLALSLP